MRITALQIENLRGIQNVRIENAGQAVVIAGPNGCGKTCILDSIRLLKSTYGGYDKDEWQQYWNERQINVQQSTANRAQVLRQRDRPATISAEFTLSDQEKSYIRSQGRPMIELLAWKVVFPGIDDPFLRWQGRVAVEMNRPAGRHARGGQPDRERSKEAASRTR